MNADLQPASQRPGPQSASSNLPSKTQTSSTTAFRLGVLFSEPLVWPEENGASPAIAPWDFAEERDLIFESLSQAGRALEVRLEAASMENLRHLILDGCRVLHYSGHGSPRFLPFEDDRGRAQAPRLQVRPGKVSRTRRNEVMQVLVQLHSRNECESDVVR